MHLTVVFYSMTIGIWILMHKVYAVVNPQPVLNGSEEGVVFSI